LEKILENAGALGGMHAFPRRWGNPGCDDDVLPVSQHARKNAGEPEFGVIIHAPAPNGGRAGARGAIVLFLELSCIPEKVKTQRHTIMETDTLTIILGVVLPLYPILLVIHQRIGKYDEIVEEFKELRDEHEKKKEVYHGT
jgi:hypothetical protein